MCDLQKLFIVLREFKSSTIKYGYLSQNYE